MTDFAVCLFHDVSGNKLLWSALAVSLHTNSSFVQSQALRFTVTQSACLNEGLNLSSRSSCLGGFLFWVRDGVRRNMQSRLFIYKNKTNNLKQYVFNPLPPSLDPK